jgi:hypothetical protein
MKHVSRTHRAAILLAATTCATGIAAGPADAGSIPPPVTITTHVTVSANSAGANGNWQNTHRLFMSPVITGQVNATGQTQVSGDSPLIGPAGAPGVPCAAYQSANDPCVDPSAPLGALLGRLGSNGTPFVIGTSQAIRTGTGILELAYNDLSGAFADNSGSYSVTINQYVLQH